MSQLQRLRLSVCCLLGLVALGAHGASAADAPAAAPAGPPVTARWVQREIHFTYMGFTTYYSCDGLRDKVRAMLLKLGARKDDLKLRQTGCETGFHPVSRFPGVDGIFSVLVPADSVVTSNVLARPAQNTGKATSKGAAPGSAPVASEPLPAQWRGVNLVSTRSIGTSGDADCELLEQFQKQILPLFTTRNLESRSFCVPRQASIGASTLKLEALQPVPPPKPAAKG